MSINRYNFTTGELEKIAGGTLYADAPIGVIQAYSGTTAPSGWLLCQGQAVSRTTYFELFSLIGTVYGAGDGSTTFNLPDLRDKAIMGVGSNGNLGDVQLAQLPNITGQIANKNGTFGITGFSSTASAYSGAFTGSEAKGAVYTGQTGNSACKVMTFNASEKDASSDINGNNVYTNNGETRPANVRLNYIVKAKFVGVPTDIVEGVKDALQYNVLKLVDTINYDKTQNYCSTASKKGSGITIPFDELESYSDGNYTARVHVMVARKMSNEDLYFKTFIDIPIAKGTDTNTGLTIRSYGFIPDWSQESKDLPSSDGVYNNGIEVFLERGTYNGAERDVAGIYYHYSTFDDVNNVIVYMPSAVGFITNSEITTYIEKIQIFKLD